MYILSLFFADRGKEEVEDSVSLEHRSAFFLCAPELTCALAKCLCFAFFVQKKKIAVKDRHLSKSSLSQCLQASRSQSQKMTSFSMIFTNTPPAIHGAMLCPTAPDKPHSGCLTALLYTGPVESAVLLLMFEVWFLHQTDWPGANYLIFLKLQWPLSEYGANQ